MLGVILEANSGVELGNFMSILAGSWDFDGPSPVKVEVAESESKVLELNFVDFGLVHGHIEVSREHTTLRGVRWR